MSDAIPVSVVLLMTPLTFSIAHGIALGFISYTAVKVLCGKRDQVSISVWILTALFIIKFALQQDSLSFRYNLRSTIGGQE